MRFCIMLCCIIRRRATRYFVITQIYSFFLFSINIIQKIYVLLQSEILKYHDNPK